MNKIMMITFSNLYVEFQPTSLEIAHELYKDCHVILLIIIVIVIIYQNHFLSPLIITNRILVNIIIIIIDYYDFGYLHNT